MQPAIWTIALTGARGGELKAFARTDLLPHLPAIWLRAAKTDTDVSDELIPIAKRLWRWVDAAVPVPFTIWSLRWHWYKACEAAGYKRIRLHDLRHFTGQTLADAGRSEANIGRFLRQKTPAITRRYTDRVLRREDAEALGDAIVPQKVPQPSRAKKAR